MKEEEKKIKTIIILLIIFVLSIFLMLIFINKCSLNKKSVKNNDNIIEQIENIKNKCSYDVLSDSRNLTENEKNEILEFLEKETVEELNAKKLEISSVNKYIYWIEYNDNTKNDFVAIMWKNNGLWETSGTGSKYVIELLEEIDSQICDECGDCG